MCCHALWLGWFERNRVREGELIRGACWISHGVQLKGKGVDEEGCSEPTNGKTTNLQMGET